MGGFERFIVIDPPTSREAREHLRFALDSGSALRLVLQPERDENVIPLRDATRVVQFHPTSARYRIATVEYLGETDNNDTMTLLVFTNTELSSSAARATIVAAGPSVP